jgi:pimeloyl-ACP methyl ester carboxylesterase
MKPKYFLRHIIVSSIIMFTLVACTSFDIKEKNFFMPRPVMSAGERLEVRGHDDTLLVGRLLRSDNPKGTIIFFNGNADLAILSGKRLKKYASFGFNVVTVDYRGSGESDGTLTLANLKSDSLAIYQNVASREDLGTKKILAYGWSLGSFAATHLAMHKPIDGLILEGAETNVQETLDAWTPWYAKLFVRFNVEPGLAAADNLVALKEYKGPLLIISGQQDKISPPILSERLYMTSNSSYKNWVNLKAKHDDIFDAPEFSPSIEVFSSFVLTENKTD